jgi:ribosomal protein S18 acetylase RimI-like enzyme
MFHTRLLEPDERPLLAPIVGQLLRHYGLPAPDDAALARLLADQPPGVEILAAFTPGGPVGLASFAQLWPGLGAAPQIYMKELYVAAAARSAGVGEVLLRALARLASARGCTRVDWSTSRDNTGALAFYRRMGARAVEEKVYLRLDAEGIARLVDASERAAPR